MTKLKDCVRTKQVQEIAEPEKVRPKGSKTRITSVQNGFKRLRIPKKYGRKEQNQILRPYKMGLRDCGARKSTDEMIKMENCVR